MTCQATIAAMIKNTQLDSGYTEYVHFVIPTCREVYFCICNFWMNATTNNIGDEKYASLEPRGVWILR